MRVLFNEKFLAFLTKVFLGLSIFAGGIAILFHLLRVDEVVSPPLRSKGGRRIPHAFERKALEYTQIGSPWLSLKTSSLPLAVPDLKAVLSYQGMNGRPDSPQDKPLLHFGINGTRETSLIPASERVYVDYQKPSQGNEIYTFTSEKRPLWIEVDPGEQEAVVRVGLDLEDTPSLEPETFKLSLKEIGRHPIGNGQGWEIGKVRVDGTLLIRQQAKWYGPDLFLENYGGDEFAETFGKHRIDFGELDSLYSVFVSNGDCMAFIQSKWTPVTPGKETLGLPLLQIKRIEERVMSLELWDPSGQKKIPLTLVKAQDNWQKESLQKEFRFLGARTRSQCVLEVGKERLLLKPFDWLMLTDAGWIKVETPDQIDAYVDRKVTGPLFVFEGFQKKEDHQILTGTIYNSSRTDFCQLELALKKGSVTILPPNEQTLTKEQVDSPFYEVSFGTSR